MPIASKHSTILEESNEQPVPVGGDLTQQLPNPPKLDMKLFEEIKKLMDDAKRYEEAEKESKRKIEKYNRAIEVAEDMIMKAQTKKEGLQKRNDMLKGFLDDTEERKKQALKYWEDYGIDVKQVSTEESDFEQYEFIYKKLPRGQCSVNLKYHDKRLEIVEHFPEILSQESIEELNTKLTSNCVNQNGTVDYRSAMILIRKKLS